MSGWRPQWAIFERAADIIYHYQNMTFFHATEFHETKGEFKGWRRIRKQSYAQNIYDAARDARALDIGITFSVRKDAYAQRKRETGVNANVSAFGFCFTAILNHLLNDAVFSACPES
jgi:hypothetical protein